MNLKELKKLILKSTENIDNITEGLASIQTNTLITASGGSMVVAKFLKSVLEKKNNIIAETMDARDLEYTNLNLFDNIFIVSYSGSNYGVKSSIHNNKKVYLLSNRKTKIKNEELLHYDISCEKSFISIETTIIPCSIILKYYLGELFAIILDEIFASIDESLFLDLKGTHLNIFSGVETSCSEEFLTSTLVESGISVPLIHEKYSYCHGRSTINKKHDTSSIYLGYNGSELDKVIKNVLDLTCENYLIMESLFSDTIVNDFYYCIQSMVLLTNIAKSKNIDLRNIKYDRDAVNILYHFKGSM